MNDLGWHCLIGTYDGTTMRLYFDGVASGTTSIKIFGMLQKEKR